MDQKHVRFNVLGDAPSTSDDFQSHDRIAAAIGKIIENNEGGKTIGLEGAWGSGKSTIIKILQETYKNDAKTFIFSFDAWVHQGDPLRRAFLDALISTAVKQRWVDSKSRNTDDDQRINDEWLQKKADLASRIRTVVTNKDPDVGGLARWLLLSMLLVPLGTALSVGVLGKYGFHINLNAWPLPIPDWIFLVGAVLLASPFIVLCGGLLAARKDPVKRKKFWSIFFQKSHVRETVHTVEPLDTSTLEFQAFFQAFMKELLHDEDKKLVIALDNLDRLPAKEAAEIWPMLRSFIDNPAFAGTSWFERLWVLVPYARDTLAAPKPTDQADADTTTAQPDGKVKGEQTRSDPHFLDKVFQMTIFVPPPILSNWKTYLEKQLKAAFPSQHDATSIHAIYLLFVRCYGALATPGPREIKNIINSMISTAIQWPDDIPLPHHAYFAILKHGRRLGDLRSRLIDGQIELYTDLLGTGVDRSLIALEYNVPRDMAAQVLYEPEIRKLLAPEPDGAALVARCDAAAFTAQFDISIGAILRDIAAADAGLFMKVVTTLCDAAFLASIGPSSRDNVIREIGNAAGVLPYLPIDAKDIVACLELLVATDTKKVAAHNLSQAIEKTVGHFSKDPHHAVFGFHDSFVGDQAILTQVLAVKSSPSIRAYASAAAGIAFAFPGDVSKFTNVVEQHRNRKTLQLLSVFDFSAIAGRVENELFVHAQDFNRFGATVENLISLSYFGARIPVNVLAEVARLMLADRSTGYRSVQRTLPYLLARAVEQPALKKMLAASDCTAFALHYLGIYNPRLPMESLKRTPREVRIQACARLVYLLLQSPRTSNVDAANDAINRGEKFYSRFVRNPLRDQDVADALFDIIYAHDNFPVIHARLEQDNLTALRRFFDNKQGVPSAPALEHGTDTVDLLSSVS